MATGEEQAGQGEAAGDISQEELERQKARVRINALVLALVMILALVAPPPWNLFAPVVFVVPLIYSLVTRLRSARAPSTQEPYEYRPKDPKDPRRYKPIG